MRLLVVDDDERVRTSIRIMLTALGHHTDEAESASAGIELLKRHRYDAILLDYYMPRHDGLWFMEHAELPKHTVTLMITGLLDRDNLEAMFQSGIRGYLAKPFSIGDLGRHLAFHQHAA